MEEKQQDEITIVQQDANKIIFRINGKLRTITKEDLLSSTLEERHDRKMEHYSYITTRFSELIRELWEKREPIRGMEYYDDDYGYSKTRQKKPDYSQIINIQNKLKQLAEEYNTGDYPEKLLNIENVPNMQSTIDNLWYSGGSRCINCMIFCDIYPSVECYIRLLGKPETYMAYQQKKLLISDFLSEVKIIVINTIVTQINTIMKYRSLAFINYNLKNHPNKLIPKNFMFNGILITDCLIEKFEININSILLQILNTTTDITESKETDEFDDYIEFDDSIKLISHSISSFNICMYELNDIIQTIQHTDSDFLHPSSFV